MNALMILISIGVLVSCGVVGTPLPPDYIGVAPTVEKQKRQHALEAERDAMDPAVADPSLEGHDISLPPSQPVGTR